jgi:putative membrane protein
VSLVASHAVDLVARLVFGWAGNLLALWVASKLVDSITYSSFGKLALAAAVLGLVNLIIKPLAKLVGCVVIILTLGVALFFINMAMLALTAWLVPGFGVGGFWSVAAGTAIVWAVNLVVNLVIDRVTDGDRKRPDYA